MALRTKQKRFCEEYLKDFNAAQAAIRSGYSKKTAREIGRENLTKPDIKAFIDSRLKELSLSADETSKMLSDIARGSLNDYFVKKRVEHTPRVEISLKQLISQIKDEIAFEEEVMKQTGYSEDEMKVYEFEQSNRKKSIIRYEIELKKTPKATRIVNGPTQWVEVVELDMVKLVADKERGRIKSITPTQYGVKVETYAADVALVNIGKIHGIFAKDNEQKAPPVSINVGNLSPEDLKTLLSLKQKVGT